MDAIERSKRQPLSRFLYGLGIRHAGEKAAYLLAQKLRTLNALMEAKKDDFDAIYEVGSVMAQSIVDFFHQEATRKLIKKIKAAGLNLEEKALSVRSSLLTGKTLVFTGELKDFTRSQAEHLVRELGGNAASSISESTDFLVAGEDPGSKYNKAKNLGVKVIDEEKFKEMIK